ncbi:MAG: ATP-binding protein [Bacteroidota bacterium]|nr:ATP-binding protein [Bacteroidota bacterium]
MTRSLSIKSERTNIRKVEAFLLDLQKTVHLEPAVLDRILISVTEAVNNGIIHGNKADPSKYVHITCTCFPDHARFEIRDEGQGFSPETVPDPRTDQNLLKEGGRGIFIIRSLMDTVVFEKEKDGMKIVMTISWEGTTP